ncbi:MAG: hypothetical protein M1267_00545 [Candidatus Thermoplasmatota archaeon]|jgi:hypothetical protein|nr:hypothetical protein [Candidatus Thermoplasmatota archaeon]MCL5800128.1 hypothetical protein [Candidatus Thermoplasmatota archaeon]
MYLSHILTDAWCIETVEKWLTRDDRGASVHTSLFENSEQRELAGGWILSMTTFGTKAFHNIVILPAVLSAAGWNGTFSTRETEIP